MINDASANLVKRFDVELGELSWLGVDDAVRANDGAPLDA
jgi:hypothetical protein